MADPTDDDPEHSNTMVFPVAAVKASIWLNLVERYTSRKFVMCSFLEIASTVAAFMKVMEPQTWLAFATLVLGTYCGSTIADKKLNGGTG